MGRLVCDFFAFYDTSAGNQEKILAVDMLQMGDVGIHGQYVLCKDNYSTGFLSTSFTKLKSEAELTEENLVKIL